MPLYSETRDDGMVIEVLIGYDYQVLDGDMLPIGQYAYQSSLGYCLESYFEQLKRNSSMNAAFKEFKIH